MDAPLARVVGICLFLGVIGSFAGGCQCMWGHNYAVAAQHESTTVGRVVRISSGKGGPYYDYVFTVNGVKFDDSCHVCRTPLAPGACDNHGPVLVYYTYQPFTMSRLEDFTAASLDAWRTGKIALAIGLPALILALISITFSLRRGKRNDDPDPEAEKGRSKSDDVPDVIHVVPGE